MEEITIMGGREGGERERVMEEKKEMKRKEGRGK